MKMKKVIGLVLATSIFIGSTITTNAQIIYKGDRTYMTLDKIEKQENEEVLKYFFKIKKFKVSSTKKTYTVKYKSNKNSKQTKKQVNQVANKLHGNNIEKLFDVYRTYKIKVVGVDKNGKTHVKIINGHKVK